MTNNDATPDTICATPGCGHSYRDHGWIGKDGYSHFSMLTCSPHMAMPGCLVDDCKCWGFQVTHTTRPSSA